jgi:hypothetical protein
MVQSIPRVSDATWAEATVAAASPAENRAAALDRAHRPSQTVGGLAVGQAFEVAEHNRQAQPLREAVDLRVEVSPEFVPVPLVDPTCCHPTTSPLMTTAPGDGDLRLGRRPQGDAVQPTADRVTSADRAGLLGEHQESRLGDILGVMKVAEHIPADVQHHRGVPLDQGREGRFRRCAAPRYEPLQQLSVCQDAHRPLIEKRLKMPRDDIRSCTRHPVRLLVPR